MLVFNGQQTSDKYTDACTIQDVQNSPGGSFVVSGADVLYELQSGPPGQATWLAETHAGPGNGFLSPDTVGIRFRSYTPGVPATVTAALAGNGEPVVALSASGQASAAAVNGVALIAKIVADGSGNAVTFSSVPAGYTHLRVVWNAYTPDATEKDLFLRFNSDTGSEYYWQSIQSKNAVLSTADSGGLATAGFCAVIGQSSAVYSGEILIPNYLSSVVSHSWVAISGGADGVNYFTNQASGLWQQPIPVTVLTLLTDGSALASGSVFSLYGLA